MNYQEKSSEIFDLHFDETARANMLETARWARFLALLGFIYMGLLLVFGFVYGYFISKVTAAYGNGVATFSTGTIAAIMCSMVVVAIGIYFYPVFALYKFATIIRQAILSKSQAMLNEGLGYLKGTFKYLGVLTIICFIFFGLSMVIMLIAAMAT